MRVLHRYLPLCFIFAIASICDARLFNLFQQKQIWNVSSASSNPITALTLNTVPEHHRSVMYVNRIFSNNRWGGRVIGPVARYMTNSLAGGLFYVLIGALNRVTVYNHRSLLSAVTNRPKSIGLLTVSNHQSMTDDPGMWSVLIPWWKMNPERIRWAICTEDVFFCKTWVTKIMGAGNVIPLDRQGTINQRPLQIFQQKLQNGSWCHIFPEGRIWQKWRFHNNETHLGKFKAGVGKCIAHSYPNDPMVLPMYIHGFDNILPEKILPKSEGIKPSVPISPLPRIGNRLKIYAGEPMRFHDKIRQFDKKFPNQLSNWETNTFEKIQLFRDITAEIKAEIAKLEMRARTCCQ